MSPAPATAGGFEPHTPSVLMVAENRCIVFAAVKVRFWVVSKLMQFEGGAAFAATPVDPKFTEAVPALEARTSTITVGVVTPGGITVVAIMQLPPPACGSVQHGTGMRVPYDTLP